MEYSWPQKIFLRGSTSYSLFGLRNGREYILIYVLQIKVRIIQMINRLVAESTIKAPFRGQPYFTISKKMLCFQADSYLKIKNLGRDAKDIDIPFNNTPLKFALSQLKPWLYELTVDSLLQVYHVEYINGIADGSFKKIAIFHNVQDFYEVKNGVILSATNKTLKYVSFKEVISSTEINLNVQAHSLKSVCQLPQNYTIKASSFSERFLVIKGRNQTQKQSIVQIFDRIPNQNAYEKSSTITYLNQVLAIYRQRYIFERKQDKQIQIYDIEQSKLIGGFTLQGAIKYSENKDNLLSIITNKDQIDYFHFFVLNPEPNSLQPLITNRVSYQKGRGDFYKIYNLSSIEASTIIDKKKNTDINDDFIGKLNDNTSSLVYILNKTKQKVEIIKLDHSKLLKSPFGEEKMNKIVYSKKSNDGPAASVESIELERSRIHSAIEIKNSEKSMEELQKKFVQNLIEIKMQSVLRKFQILEKRVQKLEKQVRKINQKLQQNISSINREQIKQNVEKLFDSLTPQFENYFTQIFKQVAGVLQQGVSYYNMKIAKQAQFHKDALTQLVTQTFKATEEIVHLSRREEKNSEQTIKKVLECKKKWTKSTEDYETRLKEVPSPNLKGAATESKGEGKVFVRADLNYPNAKRQT